MKNPSKTINKRQLTFLVAKRIGYQVHYAHVGNIISLLVDEFIDELQSNERLDIPNFCSLKLETSKPRKYHNIWKGRMAISAGKRLLKIKLSQSLRDKIVEQLDLIKTFI